jgi:putative ABC transport system permease protein
LGAQVSKVAGLGIGAQFAGTHGLGGGGEKHTGKPYTVSGVLKPCGCVLDRLVLTSLESVWQLHEKDTALDDEDLQAMQAEREVTLALVRYKSPLAAVTFPRFVNTTTDMQAAAPAVEITRLLRMVGVGADVLRGFAAVLLLMAALAALLPVVQAYRVDVASLLSRS